MSDALREAAGARRALRIRGGGTKDFYGGVTKGDVLDITGCRGIVSYEPTELVITARGGTPLAEIEATLREQRQMLAFEPPHFGAGATLGGCIAAGLSGPRRPYAGAARDFVLGVRMLDGKGRDLKFGGQVMKNVAGYDVSRLMAGSLGTLGVIVETSLKVLPLPACEMTLRREHSQAEAIALMNEWAGKPLPISATCHAGKSLYLRLSGAEVAVRAAQQHIGGEEIADGAGFWRSLREHETEFFRLPPPLWRLSVKSTTPPLNIAGQQLSEWGGALRWLKTDADANAVKAAAAFGGGHATLFRGGDKSAGVFGPLPGAIEAIHRRLKDSFDPAGILNPGRLYQGM
ncbi:MAG: glycolate oxidase subunit GlcE [Betaproteobacteria bacterium]